MSMALSKQTVLPHLGEMVENLSNKTKYRKFTIAWPDTGGLGHSL